jgi:hypothetical protein
MCDSEGKNRYADVGIVGPLWLTDVAECVSTKA